MAITGLNNITNAYKSSKDTVENPKGKLDNQAFMKLFLAELKYQDPTAPMDTDKMITQTAQLTQLETNESLKKAFDEITKQLKESSRISAQFSALNIVGKTIDSNANTFSVTDNSKNSKISLYFPTEIKEGVVKIQDEKDNTIKTIPLNNYVGKKGYIDFEWNNKDDSGILRQNGTYKAVAEYKDQNNIQRKIKLGSGPVEGVLFDNGNLLLRLGATYVPIEKIKEVL